MSEDDYFFQGVLENEAESKVSGQEMLPKTGFEPDIAGINKTDRGVVITTPCRRDANRRETII